MGLSDLTFKEFSTLSCIDSTAIDVFVKSRWIYNKDGRGYEWKPIEPKLEEMISSYPSILSDDSLVIVVYGVKKWLAETHLYLWVSGLKSGLKDFLQRNIRNTVIWKFSYKQEQAMRKIMIMALDGSLEKECSKIIRNDDNEGFRYDEKALKNITNNIRQLHDYTSLSSNRDNHLRRFNNRQSLIDHLRKYRLPESNGISVLFTEHIRSNFDIASEIPSLKWCGNSLNKIGEE